MPYQTQCAHFRTRIPQWRESIHELQQRLAHYKESGHIHTTHDLKARTSSLSQDITTFLQGEYQDAVVAVLREFYPTPASRDSFLSTISIAENGSVVIEGDVDLSVRKSLAYFPTLISEITGGLYLGGLTSAEGLTLPNSVGGNLDLTSLTSAAGLTLPNSIGGNLYLNNLTSAAGLVLPNSIGGEVYLGHLSEAEKVTVRGNYPMLKIV